MKIGSASVATIGGLVAFALTASLALAQTTNTNGTANNNNGMYVLPSNSTTNSTNANDTTNTNTSLNANTTTNGTTDNTGTNGTTGPGLPNTGTGGDAMRNGMLILFTTLVAISGAVFLVRRLA